MKPFIGVVLIAAAMTLAACCLAEVAFLMGVASPNVLPVETGEPWYNTTLIGWWLCYSACIFTAVVGSYLIIGAACLTGRVIGNVISKI